MMMTFDFRIFESVLKKAYSAEEQRPYSMETVREIFRHFFVEYEATQRKPHPPVSAAQVRAILLKLPYIDDTGAAFAEWEVLEIYPALINQYFQTRFRNCDYRISHFFSGKIRLLRFFELQRLGEIG